MKNAKIGLQFAMPSELRAVLDVEKQKPLETISGIDFFELSSDIVACAGGVGKVNAAMAAEILCRRYEVEIIINAGVAGCTKNLDLGTLVVASDFVQHDADTSAVGDPVGLVSTVNCKVFPTWWPEVSTEILHEIGEDSVIGRVATGDWFSKNDERFGYICDTFSPLLIEMEGCAIAQVCLRNNVKFIALKTISDRISSVKQIEEYTGFEIAMRKLGAVLLPFAQAVAKRNPYKMNE